MGKQYNYMRQAIGESIIRLKASAEIVDSGHWQGVPTEGKPDLMTKELLNLSFSARIPTKHIILEEIVPNWPWCEAHFQERISRDPSNPGNQYKNWPWWKGQDTAAMADGGKFSHTYQERFWPKQAGDKSWNEEGEYHHGIRYAYGDLDDVVQLLLREPRTRQAYFPIFFPEDTGAVHGGRIPCSLGYHFLLRDNRLHCWYDMRSCDAVRHFRDDLYLACRLVHWVLEQLQADNDSWADVTPGNMFFTAHSFHVHMGDYHLL